MFKILIPAVTALGLLAFAAQSKGVVADDAMAAAPQPMVWTVSHEGRMAKLAYGVANSDQLAIMLTCSPGDRHAVVYGEVEPVGARLVKAAMNAPAALDPMTGDLSGETLIGLRDPALTGLAHGGALEVKGDAGQGALTATKDERRVIGDFLAYCGSTRA